MVGGVQMLSLVMGLWCLMIKVGLSYMADCCLFPTQIDLSCLSFEGHQFQGKKAIMDKLNVSSCRCHPTAKPTVLNTCGFPYVSGGGGQTSPPLCSWQLFLTGDLPASALLFWSSLPSVRQSLPFTKIEHIITAQDHQPTLDQCIASMVVGQLKVCRLPLLLSIEPLTTVM